MKRFALAIALACALTGTALAGEIHTTGVQEPDPPVASSPAAPASTGEIHTTGATQESSDMLASVILTFIGLAFS
jgi:hypothetical protein